MSVVVLPKGAFAQTAEPPATHPSPRIVAPNLIAPPQLDQSELQRIEPRPPLAGTLNQPTDARTTSVEAKPKLLKADPLLFRPVASIAGVILAEGRTISILGVDPVPEDQMCGGAQGTPWPCGKVARTAFRSFLRARAVKCDFPSGDVPETLTVACRVGNTDIGEWLVTNGWAYAAAGHFEEQARKATDERRGMYGNAPGELPAALAGERSASTEVRTGFSQPAVSILPVEPPEPLSGSGQPMSAPDGLAAPAPTGEPGEPLPAPVSPQ
ncbi:MAG: thermonuclease family protein [Mesorhizobium sp.]